MNLKDAVSLQHLFLLIKIEKGSDPMFSPVVAKFGGTSLAEGNQFQKVQSIVSSGKNRSCIVVSAPGKRFEGDQKVTDLLGEIHRLKESGECHDGLLSLIRKRYEEICSRLKLSTDFCKEIQSVCREINASSHRDFILSRGEYLNALIMAKSLGYTMVDAKDVVFFQENGELDERKTHEAIGKRLKRQEKVIVPGFYGSDSRGGVKTFARGGSDISGALIAKGIGAGLYENWTDVSGVMTADPRIEQSARTIPSLTYKELLRVTRGGAQVYHPDAIPPVECVRIPIQIRNTNKPEDSGTIIKGDEENGED